MDKLPLKSRKNTDFIIRKALNLQRAGRVAEALQSLSLAMKKEGRNPSLLEVAGAIYIQAGNSPRGIQILDKCLKINPNNPSALSNKGVAFAKLNRHKDALHLYDEAIDLDSTFSEAYYNKALSLTSLDLLEEALDCYDKGVVLAESKQGFLQNKAEILLRLGRFEEALQCIDSAMQCEGLPVGMLGTALQARMQVSEWRQFQKDADLIAAEILKGHHVSSPFPTLTFLDSCYIQRKCAELHAGRYATRLSLGTPEKLPWHDKVRIGYFSGDFRAHPVMQLIADVFEAHDKNRFELFAFSWGPNDNSVWCQRLQPSFKRFIDVSDMSDREVAQLARQLEIDIAVDLMGYTERNRAGIFMERAAPIQAKSIGFSGTMGSPSIDYYLADPIVIPDDKRQYFAEKIVSLPDCYQPNCTTLPISDKLMSRQDYALPDDAFVFCSFNNNSKLIPQVFDSWMRILGQVPGSVLWLYATNGTAQTNLRREAEARGVPAARIVFATKVPLKEHFARQRLADLFLDTYPYNGGATSSNALRVGLPILTRSGETFASRISASLLHAAGLPELVTTSQEAYEASAVRLATRPAELRALRHKLADNLSTCALFDTRRFTRSLEASYSLMYDRYRNDLPPDHIDVPAIRA